MAFNIEMLRYFANKMWRKNKDTFVSKETGKSLSTNDYTNEDKNKLDNLSAKTTTYSNTTSGLNATNVQGAIDELKDDIDNGNIVANSLNIDVINANNGLNGLKLAGFTVNETSLYNQKSSVASNDVGCYIGTDGIAYSGDERHFKVNSNGDVVSDAIYSSDGVQLLCHNTSYTSNPNGNVVLAFGNENETNLYGSEIRLIPSPNETDYDYRIVLKKGVLLPALDSAINLGSKSLKWDKIYCNEVISENGGSASAVVNGNNYSISSINVKCEQSLVNLAYPLYNTQGSSAVVLNDEIYVLGTGNDANHYTDLSKYNPSTNEWTVLNDMPREAHYSRPVVLNGEIHLIGGGDDWNSTHKTSHIKYNATSDTWSEVCTLPYEVCNGAAIVVLNGEIHMLGGAKGDDYAKAHYKYNPSTNEWTSVSTLPYMTYRAGVVVHNGEIHLLGGSYYYNNIDTRKCHYKYNNDGTWSEVSTLPYEFYSGVSVILNDELHLISSDNDNWRCHYKYNFDTGIWTNVETFEDTYYSYCRYNTVVYNNELYMMSGIPDTMNIRAYKNDYSTMEVKSISINGIETPLESMSKNDYVGKATYNSHITEFTTLSNKVTELENKDVTASNTTYSNSTSGLTSTNVQGAIDEINTEINELANRIEKYHPKVMTVVIDQSNSNPETCITYADDAIGMTPGSSEWDDFFGHYPCLFKDGVEVGRLNPNDFTKFEDGTDADITSGNAGDVMIAFPRLGYKISTVNDIITVSMTDNPNAEGYCYLAHTRGTTVKDKFYLGAYKGYVTSSKLRSLSGKTPTVNATIGNFRIQAQANGSGYDQSAFYQLVFRQCMYLLKYKNLDSQTAVGYGYANGNSTSISTGGTNAKGMDYGETTGKLQMKLFGLEDFWGNVWEFIDGIYSDSSRNILTATENFNDTGSGYTNQGASGFSSNTGGYMSKVQGTSEKGFVLKEKSGSATTYYSDYAYVFASRLAYFGGGWSVGTKAGAFYLSVDRSASDSKAYFSARLMYL